MKMDRNIQENDGLGKYAVVNLRRLIELCPGDGPFQRFSLRVAEALRVLEDAGALEWGRTGEPDEFFLLKLKDRHAEQALRAYADSIRTSDPEFCREVERLADRSGPNSPWCKEPD